MDEGADIVLIGRGQAGIMPERPFYRQLHPLAREEGGGRGVRRPVPLRRAHRLVDVGEIGGEEGEVQHDRPPLPRRHSRAGANQSRHGPDDQDGVQT